MNAGHVFNMVLSSSAFGLLFGVFVTLFALGKFSFALYGDDGDLGAEKLLWGFTCSVVFFLSMFPLAYVVRMLWGSLF